MELILFHGRKSPDENLDDWGFQGPTLKGVADIQFTYLSTLKVCFVSEEAAHIAKEQTGWDEWDNNVLDMQVKDDLIATKDGYFGDFKLADETANIPADRRILFTPQDVIDMAENRDIPITREQAEELFDYSQDVAQEDMLGTYADALYEFQREQEAV